MDNNGQLSKGFIPVSKAVELIKADTKANPTVDIANLVRNILWVDTKHNFRIPRLGLDKDGHTVRKGSTYTYVDSPFEKELLRQTIRDKYKEYLGKELDIETVGIRRMTTVSENDGGSTRPAENKRSETAIGAELPDGLSGK